MGNAVEQFFHVLDIGRELSSQRDHEQSIDLVKPLRTDGSFRMLDLHCVNSTERMRNRADLPD